MPFKKGTSGNPVGRPKGSGNNELRNIINESIDPEKIRDMLNKYDWLRDKSIKLKEKGIDNCMDDSDFNLKGMKITQMLEI